MSENLKFLHHKVTTVYGSGNVSIETFQDDEQAAAFFEAQRKRSLALFSYWVDVSVSTDTSGDFEYCQRGRWSYE